jgi:hypothetical protein
MRGLDPRIHHRSKNVGWARSARRANARPMTCPPLLEAHKKMGTARSRRAKGSPAIRRLRRLPESFASRTPPDGSSAPALDDCERLFCILRSVVRADPPWHETVTADRCSGSHDDANGTSAPGRRSGAGNARRPSPGVARCRRNTINYNFFACTESRREINS